LLVLLVVSFVTVSGLNAAATASPGITFDATHVIATGFPSGRDIVIFGVGTAPGPYFSRLLRYTDTLVADAAGIVRYEIADGVPDRSIWFAIDAQTRDYAVAAPRGAPLHRSVSTPFVLAGLDGNDTIGLDLRLADLLLIRPGTGVWTGSCGRNSLKDSNRGKSGGMQLSVTQLAAAPRTSARPSLPEPSDLIVIVDSETLAYFVGSAKQR
jgi:hypothetical protein